MVQFVSGTQRDLFAEDSAALLGAGATASGARKARPPHRSALPHTPPQAATPPCATLPFSPPAKRRCVLPAPVPLKSCANAGNQAYYRRRNALARLRHRRLPDRSDQAVCALLAQPALDATPAAGEGSAIVGAGSISVGSNRLAAEAKLSVGSTLTLVDHAGNVLARDRDGENGSDVPWRARPCSWPCTRSTRACSRPRASTTSRASMSLWADLYECYHRRSRASQRGIPTVTVFAEADRILTRNLITISRSCCSDDGAWLGRAATFSAAHDPRAGGRHAPAEPGRTRYAHGSGPTGDDGDRTARGRLR